MKMIKKMGGIIFIAIFLCGLLHTPAGSAQQAAKKVERYDPSLYKAMEWRCIGPYRGGRVTAVTGVPSQPFTYYFGATGGGVWKTEDGGLNWGPISDGFFKTGSVGLWRRATRISFTWVWARPRFEGMFPMATACINPPTPERPGSISDSRTPARFLECASILRIRISFMRLPSAMSMVPTRREEFSGAEMAV
jgi:hypothetical protein